jgi:hypothetical protein
VRAAAMIKLLRFWRRIATQPPTQIELTAASLLLRDSARQENDTPTPPPKPLGLRKVLADLE